MVDNWWVDDIVIDVDYEKDDFAVDWALFEGKELP